MFAISYDPVDVLAAFAQRQAITYPLLSDEGSRVIHALGMLNEDVERHHAAYRVATQPHHQGVPYPGAFLLDEHGVVAEKRFQQSYRERETGSGLLAQGFGGESSRHGTEAHGGSEGVAVRAWLDSSAYRFFQRVWLIVELTVEPGLHVYGRPIPEGYVPLSIEVAPVEGLVVGTPAWPEPHPFRVAGLDEQFYVYDGTVRVALPLTMTRRDAGDLHLPVTVRYQACSASDCLMPAAVSLELNLAAAPLVS